MLSIIGNRKIIVSMLTMVFLIVGVQGISYGQAQPDLDLSSSIPTFTLSGNQNAVDPGGEFDIRVTVVNTGNTQSPITALIFYKSTDASTTTPLNDERVETAFVPAINPSGSENISRTLTAPDSAATYYYYASVLPVLNEASSRSMLSLR